MWDSYVPSKARFKTADCIHNCGRIIVDAVSSATVLHHNWCVILIHMYGYIVTASDDFDHFCSIFLTK
jgi:hypothetical protein